jgi:hypothetical protein
MISKAAVDAIRNQIGNLEDNAYRYRHIGRSETDITIAEGLEAKARDLREELTRLER